MLRCCRASQAIYSAAPLFCLSVEFEYGAILSVQSMVIGLRGVAACRLSVASITPSSCALPSYSELCAFLFGVPWWLLNHRINVSWYISSLHIGNNRCHLSTSTNARLCVFFLCRFASSTLFSVGSPARCRVCPAVVVGRCLLFLINPFLFFSFFLSSDFFDFHTFDFSVFDSYDLPCTPTPSICLHPWNHPSPARY